MRFGKLLIAGLVAGAALAATGWYWTRPAVVSTMTPGRGEAADIVYASGVVEPRNWAKVTSLVRERIVSVCNCEGRKVSKGDVLARLDDSEAQATLAELQARRDLAVKERNRVALLVERNVANESEMQRAESEVSRVEAQIAGQKARLENYMLSAPTDGVVLRQDAEVGEIAEPGNVLFWVGNPSPRIVVAEVNEEDIPRVAVGQRALLRSDAFPERVLEARVDSITPKGNPVTKSYRVRLALPDDTPLLIGMSVDVNIVVKVSKNALLLPPAAVRDDTVLVVQDGQARRKAIETGIHGTRNIEVLSGLSEDARVISPWPDGLADGARVSVTER